jgi:hypothetical protein
VSRNIIALNLLNGRAFYSIMHHFLSSFNCPIEIFKPPIERENYKTVQANFLKKRVFLKERIFS